MLLTTIIGIITTVLSAKVVVSQLLFRCGSPARASQDGPGKQLDFERKDVRDPAMMEGNSATPMCHSHNIRRFSIRIMRIPYSHFGMDDHNPHILFRPWHTWTKEFAISISIISLQWFCRSKGWKWQPWFIAPPKRSGKNNCIYSIVIFFLSLFQ